jgi:hypothetical protein
MRQSAEHEQIVAVIDSAIINYGSNTQETTGDGASGWNNDFQN